MSPVNLMRKFKNYLLEQLNPQLAYEHKKKRWEANWSRDDFDPDWQITTIPKEIQYAVDSGWFPQSSSVLDIGCGSGEIASWLAEQNFQVLGVDYSKSAIEKARLKYGNIQGNLAFETVDMCRQSPGEFDVLIDRGCLHGISNSFANDYLKTVVSSCKKGSKFLLLYGTNKNFKQGIGVEENLRLQAIQYLTNLLSSYFEIHKIEPTLMERNPPQQSVSGIAVWMIRK